MNTLNPRFENVRARLKSHELLNSIYWITLFAAPVLVLLGLYRLQILGMKTFFFLAITVCLAVFLVGCGVLLFGFGPWMKKFLVLLFAVLLAVNLLHSVYTIVGPALSSEPLTIALYGNDQIGTLEEGGRTDVNMLVTANPATGEVLIVSLPRDSYLMDPETGEYDKLTHYGLNGLRYSADVIGTSLGVDVDHVVLLNFSTFMEAIDLVGGVTIYNPYEFYFTYRNDGEGEWIKGTHFPEGEITLNAEEALDYVRERYSLGDMGDLERNKHQRIVLEAVVRKMLSTVNLSNVNKYLNALRKSFTTDMSDEEMISLALKMAKQRKNITIEQYGLAGEASTEYCPALDNYASVVIIDDEELEEAAQMIEAVCEGRKED